MIKSQFIVELLIKTIEGEIYEKSLLKQINYFSICKEEYTGYGYFNYFEFGSEIKNHKLPKDN